MVNYGRAFGLWRESSKDVTGSNAWHAYTRHNFVNQLRDGILPRRAYIHYLVQDYIFLLHFSRAWALAVVKSETLKEMRIASATVDTLVNVEMQHHVNICASFGICEQQLFDAIEEPENLSYTRYVLDAGLAGDLVDLLSALAPCIMGYGEIGLRLAKNSLDNNPYTEWIQTYASESYQQVCIEAGQLIDGALEHRIGVNFQESPRWQRLTKRFITAVKLETAFWDMSLKSLCDNRM